jgi:hypothetical protein
MRLTVALYRRRNVPNTVVLTGLLDSFVERFTGNAEQLFHLRFHLTHTKGVGRIATEAAQVGTTIDRYDIPLLKRLVVGNTVYHVLVD